MVKFLLRSTDLGESWRRIIFGVCFFHAIIQERKKFGPLGWNILYEFNDSDRECCLLNLKIFCVHNRIPWNALIYTTGEITYGGRVTDGWDLRCMKTILAIFFSPKTLDVDYVYSPSGNYYCPVYSTLQEYKDFVETFPIIEDPEIFGMHENANIAYQLKEAQFVMNTILEVQPQESVSGEGKSSSDIAYEIADTIKERIQLKIDSAKCSPDHLMRDSAGRLPSLTTVLIHEVDRYNILLKRIHASIENLQRAIKGFVVMSEELENVFVAFINNQVPQMWHNVNVYPSLKTLGSWIRNLELRIDFVQVKRRKMKNVNSHREQYLSYITDMVDRYETRFVLDFGPVVSARIFNRHAANVRAKVQYPYRPLEARLYSHRNRARSGRDRNGAQKSRGRGDRGI